MTVVLEMQVRQIAIYDGAAGRNTLNSLKKYVRYATNTTSEFTQDSEFRQVMANINENINSATG